MNNDKLVSIIIPVYNGEQFLDKCMDSVLNQTYKNIEIILSDDGSTDNSLDIIKKYAKNNKRVKWDSHGNVGLSMTRNIAFEKVTGDYVTYLDVDDYFDYDFIENMLMYYNDEDIIIGGFKRIYPNGEVDFTYSLNNSKKWNKYKRVTVWAKLYNVDFLRKNNIIYPEKRLYGEDVVYTMRCLSRTDNVKVIPYIGYNYLINENSITHKDTNKIKNDVPKMLWSIHEYIKEDKVFIQNNKKYCKYYYIKIFTAFLVEQAKFLEIDDLTDYCKENMDIIMKIFNECNYKFSFIWMNGEQLKVNVMINLYIFFRKIGKEKTLIRLLNKNFYRG